LGSYYQQELLQEHFYYMAISMIKNRLSLILSSTALVALLTACASKTTAPEAPLYTPSEELLLEKISTLFHDGDYRAVIKKVKEMPEATLGGMSFRTDALKYKAFSECVSKQPRNCRNTFRQLLGFNPSFDLTPAESNHPQWGKVFAEEKARSDAAVAKANERLQATETTETTDNRQLKKPRSMPRAEIRVGPRQPIADN
jgi:hypothetical protein